MNRKEILEQLKEFPYDSREYWAVMGGAMVLYGIRAETSDIDLGCSTKMADRLEKDGYAYRRTESGNRYFRYGDHIEIFENWLKDSVLTLDGFQVVSVKGLMEMKRELGRPKDLEDLRRIAEFEKSQNHTD